MKRILALLMMTIFTASIIPLHVSADPTQDIPTNAANTGVHDSLVAALTHANLVSTLQGTGPFTVFAPTDQAFIDAGINLADFDTPEENATLTDILLYHVVSGSVASSAVTDGMIATMVNGDKAKFGVNGATVSIGDATVTIADVQASNGIIHVIDKVLMPPVDIPSVAQTTGIHNSLVAAVIQADLLTTLEGTGPFTLFAPTDQAFIDAGIDLATLDTPEGKQTLADILLYHVVSSEVPSSAVTECMSADAANGQPLAFTVDGGVMVNDANVTMADVIANNGLIHVIDKVLTPTDTPNDIPRTAQCTGIHNSLVAGVIQAELLETLQGTGPFTVFAPTDQAFIDAGIDLAALDTPEGKQTLADILLYHVVSAEVPSSAVTECMSATSANGQPLAFTVDGGVMVNDANVTLADVNTSNGVIHVIDKVLSPTDAYNSIPRTAQCTGFHDSLVAAVIQAELLATLEGTGPFTLFAPTDDAFTEAGIDLASLDTPEGKQTLSDILLYHVIAGDVPSTAVTDCMSANAVNGQPLAFTVDGGVMVNGANVTLADVATSNGVIHVIDKVLTPTDTPNDIPRTAQCTGEHNSLVAGVIQAELLPTLQGTGPFTVFAPTDQAFVEAGIDLAALDTPEGKQTLSDILLYHVVTSEVPASAVTDCMSANAANGQPLSFTVGDSVMVNGATVTATDVPTSNGLIHVIDKVLSPTDTPNDIPRTAQCTGQHNSLVAGVVQAELLETLQGEGPFTVFAPTDQAFIDAGIDLAALDTPEGKQTLSDILLYHVVSAEVPSSAVTECMSADAANGQPLAFTVDGGVMVNGANVTLADVATSNGVIHVIDKVLTPTDYPNDIPRTAQCTGNHSALVAAVIQAELLETLQGTGPFTVFAPTDQAFVEAGIDLGALDTPEGKQALSDILLYHVVTSEVPASAVTNCMSAEAANGQSLSFIVDGGVMVNGATVTLADVTTSNGVIHVIDKVLTPTDLPNDIPGTAQCTGQHNSLVAGVIQAELLETLQGEGPFTVFAPTDQAFIDAGIDLAALDNPEGKQTLADILLYHVVPSQVPASAVTDCMSADAANGQPLAFTVNEAGVMVNGASVTLADVNTSNGIIHVIDKVLMPSDSPRNIPSTASCTGVHTSLVAALIQAELVAALEGDGPFTVFAPTDQAFTDAGINLEELNTPEGKATLTDILLFHVYQGTVESSDIFDSTELQMMNGKNATVSLSSGINGASITSADVFTSNGVIHVIDAVLTPSDDQEETGDSSSGATDEDDDWMTYLYIGIGIIVLAGIAGLMFARRGGAGGDMGTNFGQNNIINDLPIMPGNIFTAQPSGYVAQEQTAQPAYQAQPIVQQPAYQPQPVVAEPQVTNQWTDTNGHTWRSMSDGSTLWWNGTDWQKAA